MSIPKYKKYFKYSRLFLNYGERLIDNNESKYFKESRLLTLLEIQKFISDEIAELSINYSNEIIECMIICKSRNYPTFDLEEWKLFINEMDEKDKKILKIKNNMLKIIDGIGKYHTMTYCLRKLYNYKLDYLKLINK